MVVVGPFVEEYIFRHLLIGKLSRRVNIWLCCALSVVLFAALHIVGQEALTLTALMPYLAMGATLVFVYVWTGQEPDVLLLRPRGQEPAGRHLPLRHPAGTP